MIKADFHCHSKYSTDGISSLRDQIGAAIDRGLETLCITEHMDYAHHMYEVPSFFDEFPSLSIQEAKKVFQVDTDEYMRELFRLKEEFSPKIDLRFGIELGLQPSLGEHYRDYVKKYPFDFCIGSSHEVDGIDPYCEEFLTGKTPLDAYRRYFEAEAECARSCLDSFDVYGHIDYALRYHQPQGFVFRYEDFADELDTLLTFLISNGKGIECNTSGIKYFGDELNPHTEILKRYKRLGGEIITVGSDAHKASDVAGNFELAANILKSCGFDYYTVFKDRKPEQLHL